MFNLCGEIRVVNSVDDDMSAILFSANSTFTSWFIQHQFNAPFVLVGLAAMKYWNMIFKLQSYVLVPGTDSLLWFDVIGSMWSRCWDVNLDICDVCVFSVLQSLKFFSRNCSGERASRAVLCRHAESVLSTGIIGGNSVSAQSLGRDVPYPVREGHFLLGAGRAYGGAWKSSGGGYGQRP